jgi:hypothetical protein
LTAFYFILQHFTHLWRFLKKRFPLQRISAKAGIKYLFADLFKKNHKEK